MNILDSQNHRHFKLNKKLKHCCLAFLAGIITFSIFYLAGVTYAQDATPRRATFDPSRRAGSGIEVAANAFRGTIRVYPNGETPTRSPNQHPVLVSSGTVRDQIWVAGDSESWAHFRFWQGMEYQGRRIDPLVQAGSDLTPTRYTFPCRYNLGSGVVAWGLNPRGTSACEVITVSSGNRRSALGNAIANKSNSQEIANGNDANLDQITITRLAESTLIHVYNNNGDAAVDVLVGNVQIVISSGAAQNVAAGNRYLQTPRGGRVEPINLSNVVNSPSIQTFLNEANWSSDVTPLLNELKSSLSGVSQVPQLNETQKEILDVHNQLRSEVNVPPLSWSEELENYAQEWANELSRRGSRELEHRSGNPLSGAGENLAAGSSVAQMLGLWAVEKENYVASTNTCRPGRVCGHYTQMVWRNTTRIGCGIAPHRMYQNVMVCNYSPPGNYAGQRPY